MNAAANRALRRIPRQDLIDILIDFLGTYEYDKLVISEEYTNSELVIDYVDEVKQT